jgi:hypothetical protein
MRTKRQHRLADLDRGDYSILDTVASVWMLLCMFLLAWLAARLPVVWFALPIAALMAVSLWRLREVALERADAAKRSGCLAWGLLLVHLATLFVGLVLITGLLGLRKVSGLG